MQTETPSNKICLKLLTSLFEEVEHLDQGQYRGHLSSDSLDVVRQPSVMWLRFEPQMDFDNDQSKKPHENQYDAILLHNRS